MHAELLMIGTELLLGQIQDTNATRIAQTLAEHGVFLYQKTTVGDNEQRILAAMHAATARSEVVLCSGGLGPTEDDITRECVALLAGKPLEFHQDLYDKIQDRYIRGRKNIPANNRKQAMLPQGAVVLDNPHGTAPGFLVEVPQEPPAPHKTAIIACMPGVPHELDAMLMDQVLPLLEQRFQVRRVVHCRTLKVCGLGESRIDVLIGDLIREQTNPTVGLLASLEFTRIRIAAQAPGIEEAKALIAPVEAAIRERLEGRVMGADDDTLEGALDALFSAKGWTLSIAESFTGGVIAHKLTAAGARCFAGARVLSENQALPGPLPQCLVDVSSQLLLEFPSKCSLVLLTEPETRTVHGHFRTPEGATSWQTANTRQDGRGRIRCAIIAMEHVRCYLAGTPEELLVS